MSVKMNLLFLPDKKGNIFTNFKVNKNSQMDFQGLFYNQTKGGS